MEQREWLSADKSAWGPGPWQSEPDKAQWVDEATGLPCLAVRNSGGAWCGYVGVLPGHPLHGVDYSTEVEGLAALLERRKVDPIGATPSFATLLACLTGELHATPEVVFRVHGGITFASRCQPYTRETWEHWRERLRDRAAEAAQYPQGDAARALHEAGAALDDYGRFVAFAESRFICHIPAPGEPDDVWWFGFDCAHAGDASPAYRAFSPSLAHGTYRDLMYVRSEVGQLAEQLAVFAPGAGR